MKAPNWMRRLGMDRDSLLQTRLLKPHAERLSHPDLWRMKSESVARGVALGMFFGVLIPIAQIFFAAAVAVFFRGNIAVAAVATLVTNPFTFPLVYFLAIKLGRLVLGHNTPIPPEILMHSQAIFDTALMQQPAWWNRVLDWFMTAGGELIVGLAIIASGSAVIGYFGVKAGFAIWRRFRLWRRSRRK